MLRRLRVYLLGEPVSFDRTLLLTAAVLLASGLVLVSSASIMEAYTMFGDRYYYLKRQSYNLLAALFMGVLAASIPTDLIRRASAYLMLASLALLVLVLVVGAEVNDARRWIRLGPVNIQPAEILKLSWIFYFASFCTRKISEVRNTNIGFIKAVALTGLMSILLLAQPDFGSLFVLTCITFGMLFVAGAGLLKYIFISVAVAAAGAILVVTQPYRMRRITSFLDPWQDQFGSGYQLTQSLMAFGRGGMWGEGLGNSVQKLGYLPEAHTDFVTAILGEECGFAGMILIIVLEFALVYRALALAFGILRHKILFQGFVAFGIGAWFCLQSVINIGAASGALPTKGLTLPLVSYGGSSLIVSVMAVAILLRIDFEWKYRVFGRDEDD